MWVSLNALPGAQTLTANVIANNTYAISNRPPLPHLKHTFLVIRENRTYDEVLGGRLPVRNGDCVALTATEMDGWAEGAGASIRFEG